MRGENTNDVIFGATVFRIRLARPNMAPRHAPTDGPSSIEPIITGTCMMVAFINPRLMKPIGVKVRRKIIAAKSDAAANLRVSDEVLCQMFIVRHLAD
jgi:hypothetical protein